MDTNIGSGSKPPSRGPYRHHFFLGEFLNRLIIGPVIELHRLDHMWVATMCWLWMREAVMTEFHLCFSKYGNWGRNYHYTMVVRARNLEAAIRSVEKKNPSYYYCGCIACYPVE